ncbi:hypothetical protein CGCVW01_v013899 [Colletotrichum viniferum]|nr:hypothetical protein CGCVW01_v013899 [Colletotrichum viniferum]
MSGCQRKPITTEEAPGPYPPLSQAMVHGGFVFCSGSTGMNPQTNSISREPLRIELRRLSPTSAKC